MKSDKANRPVTQTKPHSSLEKKATKKILTGTVVSNRMDKTIVVKVTRRVPHPRYKKIIKHSSKIFAHDEGNVCKVGDVVKITESCPISKKKAWILVEVIKKK